MQFLTIEEAQTWAEAHGYSVNEAFGRPLVGDVPDITAFPIPSDAGARVNLARVLWESAATGVPEVLVWVTEWGVWPSGEHRPLAEATRRALGAPTQLHESPGHLVRRGEGDDGLSVFCLAILFLWDGWVLPAVQRRPAVFVSHDEHGAVDPRGDDHGLVQRLNSLGVLKDLPRAI